jgi:hypothetical protein
MDADATLSVAAFFAVLFVGGGLVGLSPAPLQSPPSQMHTVPVPWPSDSKLWQPSFTPTSLQDRYTAFLPALSNQMNIMRNNNQITYDFND